METERTTAPVRRGVVLGALAAILLLAALVCALHGINALRPRGSARVSDYTPLERMAQEIAAEGQETLTVYADGALRFVPQVETVAQTRGVLRVSGLLLRPGQDVGEVRVRVALVPQVTAADGSAAWAGQAVLLATQMVRRSEAARWGADDHCGFAATAARRAVPGGQYAVVLLDESDGARRLIDTNVRIALTRDGLVVVTRAGGEGGV